MGKYLMLINSIFEKATQEFPSTTDINKVKEKFELEGGLDILEHLQKTVHNQEVLEQAASFIEKFFEYEDEFIQPPSL